MRRIGNPLGEILKRFELIEKALKGELRWVEVAEVLRLTPRQVRRLRKRYEVKGVQGLEDYRRSRRAANRKSRKTLDQVLELYRTMYEGWNIKHFHEKLTEEHGVSVSYTWTLYELRRAKLIPAELKRGTPRERRERRPLPGMLLQIDGSDHAWLGEEFGNCCIVGIIDDATNEVYSAHLVPQENLSSVFWVLRETIEKRGIFCSLYADRASHFFYTPEAGGKVDLGRRTQCQVALEHLGVEMIPAYSPQAKGRIERLWGTLQGRLPQELKRSGIKTLAEADRYLNEIFLPDYNRRFTLKAREQGSAFASLHPSLDLHDVFAIKTKRVVRFDNTVSYKNKILQIPATDLRASYARCEVTVLQHMNDTLSIRFGPHLLARYSLEGKLLSAEEKHKIVKTGT